MTHKRPGRTAKIMRRERAEYPLLGLAAQRIHNQEWDDDKKKWVKIRR